MAKAPTQIAFTTDRRGRPLAHRWCFLAKRWIRVSLDGAEVDIASGVAIEVQMPAKRAA